MPLNIYVPEKHALTELQAGTALNPRPRYANITKPWLALFLQFADLLRRISATGTVGGVVVTDENGLAQVVLNEMDGVAYAGGDFTATGGTWTVEAGDVLTYALARLGRMVTLAWWLNDTTIAGAPTELQILLPDSLLAQKSIRTLCELVDDGTPAVGVAWVAAGNHQLHIQRLDGAALTVSTDNTDIRGVITFEVEP
jgi:hypothetical protein